MQLTLIEEDGGKDDNLGTLTIRDNLAGDGDLTAFFKREDPRRLPHDLRRPWPTSRQIGLAARRAEDPTQSYRGSCSARRAPEAGWRRVRLLAVNLVQVGTTAPTVAASRSRH